MFHTVLPFHTRQRVMDRTFQAFSIGDLAFHYE